MRAFIQCKNNIPVNPNIFNAYYGLKYMGFECIFVNSYEELLEHYHHRNEVISGGIELIKKRLQDFNIKTEELNYPEELKSYLGRKIWKSTMNTVRDSPDKWPVFVKSVEGKKLTGKIISSIGDLVGCGISGEDYDVLCSDPISITSEYRVFVRYGKILDIKHYSGDPLSFPDPLVIQNIIKDYKESPKAYGLDVCTTLDGKTRLVEINDAWALGCYGLDSLSYAKLLLTRWADLTETLDEFYYL